MPSTPTRRRAGSWLLRSLPRRDLRPSPGCRDGRRHGAAGYRSAEGSANGRTFRLVHAWSRGCGAGSPSTGPSTPRRSGFRRLGRSSHRGRSAQVRGAATCRRPCADQTSLNGSGPQACGIAPGSGPSELCGSTRPSGATPLPTVCGCNVPIHGTIVRYNPLTRVSPECHQNVRPPETIEA
jgi:hypothetical protein